MTRWNILDRLPLQRVTAAVRIRGVDVLPSGNEPHRVRLADEPVDDVAQQFEPYQRRLPKPSAIQLRSQRRGADLSQFVQNVSLERGQGRVCIGDHCRLLLS